MLACLHENMLILTAVEKSGLHLVTIRDTVGA